MSSREISCGLGCVSDGSHKMNMDVKLMAAVCEKLERERERRERERDELDG